MFLSESDKEFCVDGAAEVNERPSKAVSQNLGTAYTAVHDQKMLSGTFATGVQRSDNYCDAMPFRHFVDIDTQSIAVTSSQ